MAARLKATLPAHRPRPRSGRREVPTRVLDEDTYPVGGFSSLSTRGTVESLLHSQLAYMEDGSGPEGFEIKGNEESKLYHVPGSRHYNQTKAEYYFATVEAAEAAGFSAPGGAGKADDATEEEAS